VTSDTSDTIPAVSARRRLLLFTKPAREGRVKTRLIGDLTPREAALLHRAFVDDLLARLAGGDFDLQLAWALEEGEVVPSGPVPGVAQRGADLGARLFNALSDAAREAPYVAAVGSDHPTLPLAIVEEAFAALEAGAEVVLGPAEDGGYYLIALAAERVSPHLFTDIPWSTERVLEATLERCRELGLTPHLLQPASDVDTPADLARLAESLAAETSECPRTRELLAAWGRLRVADMAVPR
jgi:rSAM/selenodomain-associated transferase 1